MDWIRFANFGACAIALVWVGYMHETYRPHRNGAVVAIAHHAWMAVLSFYALVI